MLIVINDIPPSNNKFLGNSHSYHEYNHIKKKWHLLVKYAIKDKPAKPIQKAIVKITYYFKDRRRRDPDNYSGKFLLDPLVIEGVIIDDSFNVITLVLDSNMDKANPRTEIEITEVEV